MADGAEARRTHGNNKDRAGLCAQQCLVYNSIYHSYRVPGKVSAPWTAALLEPFAHSVFLFVANLMKHRDVSGPGLFHVGTYTPLAKAETIY